MVSSKRMRFKSLSDGEEYQFPCGVMFLAVTPVDDEDSWDLFYSDSPAEGIFGSFRPFSVGGVGSIFSSENTQPGQLTVRAHGNIHLIYIP